MDDRIGMSASSTVEKKKKASDPCLLETGGKRKTGDRDQRMDDGTTGD